MTRVQDLFHNLSTTTTTTTKQERGGKKKYGKILIMGDGYMGVNYTIVYTSVYI